MKKYIYINIYNTVFGVFVSIGMNIYSFISKPFMVYGFLNLITRKFHRRTRISNTTKLINRKNLDISDNVWIWHYSILDASASIKIHEGVQIGAWVGIFTHSSHNAIRLNGDKYFELSIKDRIGYYVEPVEIGAYTFIGTSAIILPGVTIGKGSIVSAGSIVNKSFPDFSIISGSPAVLVGNTKNVDNFFLRDNSIVSNYYDKK